MTLHDHVTLGRERLVQAGLSVREARLDAEVLARHVLGWDRATFISQRLEAAPDAFAAGYERLVARRVRREPVSFIMGVREFWGLDFEVSPDVLIPRHETELILEEAVRLFEGRTPGLIVDAGTGSGCLGIALATEFPGARVVATDISPAALAVARRNAARHHVAGRIGFVRTNFTAGLGRPPDLIVSNPPYVPSVSAPGLLPEVREYEPWVALFGGPDGLVLTRELLGQAAGLLRPGGALLMEFGLGQEAEVRQLVAVHQTLEMQGVRDDLQGIARVAIIGRVP